MKPKGLLVAAGLLALLAGGVFYSNRIKKEEAAKPPAETSPKLISVAEADVTKVVIERAGGETTAIERGADNAWKITQPQEYRADKDSVTSFLSTALALASDKTVEEKPADLAQFGLTSPSMTVTVYKKDGKTAKVLLGDDTPTASGPFAKAEGDAKVYTLASWTKTSLDKKASDLRDKRLLTFDGDKLVRVELTAKKSTTEFAKNNQNEWQILKPKPLRADGWQVEELVRKLKDAKLDPAISDEDAKKAAGAFAGAAVVATASVTDNAGAQTLEVRKSKDNKYYAKSSVVAGIHSITNDIGDGLDKATDDFRNKKLFDFGFSDPSKVEYKDGARTVTLSKDKEKWIAGGKEMDNVSVQSLVDKLRDLSAAKFVESGFTTPAIELAVTSNEGKRVERVSISKAGDSFIARRENEPALYQLETAVVTALSTAAGDVKEPPKPETGKDTKKK